MLLFYFFNFMGCVDFMGSYKDKILVKEEIKEGRVECAKPCGRGQKDNLHV